MVLLAALRISAFLWATPLFSLARVPARVKLILVLVFAAGTATLLPMGTNVRTDVGHVVAAGLAELLVGSIMGFGILCSFAAFQFGGRLLDLQMGFGVASLINPSSEEQEPLLGTLLLVVGVMTFYLVQAHHWVARSFIMSFEWFPLGHMPTDLRFDAVVAQFGVMFTLGTMLVAPVVAVLLLIDSGLALASKTMPQLNVFMLSIPIKIVVGLLVLAASAPFTRLLLQRVLQTTSEYWRALAV